MMNLTNIYIYLTFTLGIIFVLIYSQALWNKHLSMIAPPVMLLLFDTIFYQLHISNEYAALVFIQSVLVSLSFIMGTIYEAILRPRPVKLGNYNESISTINKKCVLSNLLIFDINSIMSILLLGTGLFVIYYMFTRVGFNITELLSNPDEFDKFYSVSRSSGGAYLYYVLYTILFTQIYIYFKTRKTKHAVYPLIFICFLSLQGGRGFLICALLMLALIYSQQHKVKLFLIILLCAFLLIIIIYATSLRVSNWDFYFDQIVRYDFDLSSPFSDIVNHIKNKGVSWFLFLNDLTSFIPSAIWPEKPISTAETYLINYEKASNGTSITYGLYGNALLHLGMIGFIIVCIYYFILGIIFSKFDKSWFSGYKSYFFMFLLAFQIIWLRGGLFSVRMLEITIVLLAGTFLYKVIKQIHYVFLKASTPDIVDSAS